MIGTLFTALASVFMGMVVVGTVYQIFQKLDKPSDKVILIESLAVAVTYAIVGVITTVGAILFFNAVAALTKIAYLIVVGYL